MLELAERSAKGGSWHWDIKQDQLTWSPGLFRLWGKDPATDRPSFALWANSLHPDDRQGALDQVTAALQRPGPIFLRYRVIREDGVTHWFESYGQLYCDATGKPDHMCGFCLDVDDRVRLAQEKIDLEHHLAAVQRLEYQLRQKQQQLEHTLNASGLGLWDLDIPSGRVICDERCCKILGYEPDTFPAGQAGWEGLIHPEDRERFLAVRAAHFVGETETYRNEYRVRHRNGHYVWIRSSGRVVEWDADGHPLRCIGTIQDISSERRLSMEGLGLLERIEALVREVTDRNAHHSSHEHRQNASPADTLSRRQRQILVLIATGMTSGLIAERLGIATGTVISHRRELMRKLQLHSTAEVTSFAMRHQLIPG